MTALDRYGCPPQPFVVVLEVILYDLTASYAEPEYLIGIVDVGDEDEVVVIEADADRLSAGTSASGSPATGSSSPGTQPVSGNNGPPVGQVDPRQTARPTSPPPGPTGPKTTYTTSPRYPFTLLDRETIQFQGTERPDKGAAGAWGQRHLLRRRPPAQLLAHHRHRPDERRELAAVQGQREDVRRDPPRRRGYRTRDLPARKRCRRRFPGRVVRPGHRRQPHLRQPAERLGRGLVRHRVRVKISRELFP